MVSLFNGLCFEESLCPPPEDGIAGKLPSPSGIYKGCGGWNSSLHACVTSALSKEPFPHH